LDFARLLFSIGKIDSRFSEIILAMHSPANKTRDGMTVLEVTVALTLLGLGMVLTAQVFTQCARQHLAGQRALVAQWETANVLEHLAGLRYEEVTSEAVQAIQPSPQLHAALHDATLHITVVDSPKNESPDAAPPHKRIHVEVNWPAEEGSPHSVSLTGWKFPSPSESSKVAQEAIQ
jgi:hypothetical protein